MRSASSYVITTTTTLIYDQTSISIRHRMRSIVAERRSEIGMEDTCDTGLVLALGYGRKSTAAAAPTNSSELLEPSLLTLGRQPSLSSHSTLSSHSNLEREDHDGGGAVDRISSRPGRQDREGRGGGGGGGRKKLRLSNEQSAFLEGMFKAQSTLNPKQKVALAKQLNLRPRQVEVWFQNRRARTKLKQTEVDCELLRKYSDMLAEENQRLKMELQELKALAPALIYSQQLPAAAAVTICASCRKISDGHAGPKAAAS